MPDPDGSSSASSWIKDRFPEAKEGTSIALTGFDEKLKRRSEVSKLLDKLKKVKGKGYIFGQSLKKCPANSEGYTT